jgi:hypothetical protein
MMQRAKSYSGGEKVSKVEGQTAILSVFARRLGVTTAGLREWRRHENSRRIDTIRSLTFLFRFAMLSFRFVPFKTAKNRCVAFKF